MKNWRQIREHDHVIAIDSSGRAHHATVDVVPDEFRDLSGSHATTDKFQPAKAWVRIGDDSIPWPVDALHWPAQTPVQPDHPVT